MSFGYPRQTKRQQLGSIGEIAFERFVVSKLMWVYRSVPQESDFGIDGYIDIVIDTAVTGQMIAVQIKCGQSYFNKKTTGGLRYDGDNKHLNYYLNIRCPIILIVFNEDCSEGRWIEFDANKTIETKSGWWIEIPDHNNLLTVNKSVLEYIAGPVIDYSDNIRQNWDTNKSINESDFGIITITKEEILECDLSGILELFKRMSISHAALIKNYGKVEILIEGYDDDEREISEIEEVRKWFKESMRVGVPWAYFLNTLSDFPYMGLTLPLCCTCDLIIRNKTNKGTAIEFTEKQQLITWLEQSVISLNYFTIANNIPKAINEELEKKVGSLVMGLISPSS